MCHAIHKTLIFFLSALETPRCCVVGMLGANSPFLSVMPHLPQEFWGIFNVCLRSPFSQFYGGGDVESNEEGFPSFFPCTCTPSSCLHQLLAWCLSPPPAFSDSLVPALAFPQAPPQAPICILSGLLSIENPLLWIFRSHCWMAGSALPCFGRLQCFAA